MLSITQNLSLILGRTVVTYCMRLEAQRKSTNDTSLTVCIYAVVLKVIGWLQLTHCIIDNTTLIVHTCSHSEYALAFSLKKLMVVFLEVDIKLFVHKHEGTSNVVLPLCYLLFLLPDSSCPHAEHPSTVETSGVHQTGHLLWSHHPQRTGWAVATVQLSYSILLQGNSNVFLLRLEAWHFRWTAVPVHARRDKPHLQTSTWRHSTYSSILF